MIKYPGCQPTKSQSLTGYYAQLISKRSPGEVIIVHHVSEDTPKRLQLEVERRCSINGLAFERVIL